MRLTGSLLFWGRTGNLSHCTKADNSSDPVYFSQKCFRERAMTKTQALVLFSGGQDSTVCLAWALARFDHVETVGFDYGQRHAAELTARPRILEKLRSAFTLWNGRLGDDHLLALD